MSNPKHSDMLTNATAASETLEAAGITILGSYHNGRRSVLIIDRKPEFIRGVVKRIEPCPGGRKEIHAAPFHGVQLEWVEAGAEDALQAVVNG